MAKSFETKGTQGVEERKEVMKESLLMEMQGALDWMIAELL